MTPQSLKSAILQLAIQGKLVPQRPEDGVARVPAALNTEKRKARRHEEEIKPLFDIPESWKWVQLGAICEILDSKRRPITKADRTPGPYPYYGASCIQDYVAEYIFDEPLVLLGEDGAKWGRGDNSAFQISGKTWVNNHAHVLRPVPDIDHTYLVHVLCILDLHPFVTGTTVPKLNQKRMRTIPIPLPPLPEQHRIVAKIEELLPLVDRYEQAWTKLEDFNRRFPADMQKSLLQMAIQGHLVDQRPEEGTGEQLYKKILAAKNSSRPKSVVRSPSSHPKLLPPITEDEIPFEIPDSWKWARLGDVADVQLGKMLDKGKNKGTPHPYLANLSVRWRSFDLSSLRTMPFMDHECEKFALLPGDVLMCEGGVPGRCAVWRQEHSPIKYQKAVHRIRSAVLFPDFIQLYFEAIVDNTWFAEQCTGTTIKHLPRERLIQTPIPLPPLSEQKRIVAKLEELLPLCERLN